MSVTIKSGGSGNVAIVDARGQLHVDAVTKIEMEASNNLGKTWDMNHTLVNLTTANESAIFYLKNTSATESIIVKDIFVNIGASTGGTGGALLKLLRNPTGGTLVDAATPGRIRNRNFGSTLQPAADWLVATTTDLTLTGGETFFETLDSGGPANYSLAFEGTVLLTAGASLGITYTPKASNTSQDVIISTVVYIPLLAD